MYPNCNTKTHGVAGASLSETATGITIPYVEPGSLHKKYSMHFVRLSPLAERTTYSYKCKSAGSDYSPVFQFKSLYYGGDGTQDTKIAIFGDMGVYSYTNMGNLERDFEAGKIDAM